MPIYFLGNIFSVGIGTFDLIIHKPNSEYKFEFLLHHLKKIVKPRI